MAKGNFTFVLDKASYNEIKTKLKALEDVDQSAAISKALKEGVKPIINQGKANLATSHKVKTGALKRSQGGTRTYKKQAMIKAGFKRPGGAVAHLLDRGTAKRWTKKGKYTGSISAGRPYTGSLFWTRAVASKSEEALNTLADAINTEIIKIMSR